MDARPEPVSEARQRWRLTVARASDAPRLGQRETGDAWTAALEASGLPLAHMTGSPGRVRLAFGAALGSGIAAEGELVDVFLTDRLPRWRVREALEPVMPDGWTLVDLADVWLGGAPLAGTVAAADYRVVLADTADAAALAAACARLLEARTIPREREKGGGTVAYDLRPLLLDVALIGAGPPPVLRIRVAVHPTLGTGRPEEVVAALAEVAGRPLTPTSTVRERLILADDLGARNS